MRMSRLPAVAAATVLLAGSTAAVALASNGADDATRPVGVEDNNARVVHEPKHVAPAPAVAPGSTSLSPAAAAPPAAKPAAKKKATTKRSTATVRHAEPGDDRGTHAEPGDDRGTHVEPGDDRGTHVEPGDDRGTHVEPGDDSGQQRGKGSSGRGGSDHGTSHS